MSPRTRQQFAQIKMRIDQAFKGTSASSLTLVDTGMCDGPTFQVGERYLMYTSRFGPEPVVFARGCTRSRHIKEAADDLRYLKSLNTAPPVGQIFGVVLIRDELPGFDDIPLAGAHVRASDGNASFTAVTNTKGRYSIQNLEPGEYSVTVDKPGFWIPHEYTPGPVKIP
jgi:hypothetical protein